MKKTVSVILHRKDKILMQLRDNNPDLVYPNYWTVPSGQVESGENELQAAKREFYEETGYKLNNPKLIRKIKFKDKHGIQIISFYKDIYDNKQQIGCYEGQKMEFKTAEEIQSLLMVQVVKQIILESVT